ncbi:sensor domain-containing protein [Kribbella sp. NBC_01505]|uniref:sensor domain-containing protein n=1 Tax=Kribbella sp. NBC_01505 TaxID=2903580 RepID=UPI0038705FD1
MQRPLAAAVLALGLGLSLVACDGGNKPAAAPSNTTPTAPVSTPTPPASTAPTTPSAPPAPAARTKASLTKALLALDDLPSGLAVEPDSGGDDDGTKLTSSNAKCAPLIKLFNDEAPTGSKVTVSRDFSGGQEGPFVGEQLDALPSAAAAKAYLTSVKTAVASCKQAKLTITGAGTSPVAIAEVSAPKAGDAAVGVRVSATSGALQGLEIHFAFAALNDVLLSMNFDSSDIEEPTLAAADKVREVLGASTQGA